jgi:hypothetical protein
LKPDFDFLFAVVKSMLIHPNDAEAAEVIYDGRDNWVFRCHSSTVDTMLQYDRLGVYLEKRILPLATPPSDRAILTCDHQAVLLVSFLRHLGIPARARAGYCTYIVEGVMVPHWITEVYDEAEQAWMMMDPEKLIKHVDRSCFLFAAEAWKQHMEDGREFWSYSGLTGRQALKYALLNDLNCIFKNELLAYEWRSKENHRRKPEILDTPYEALPKEGEEDIQAIAEMMLNPDQHLPELWRIYGTIVEARDLRTSGFDEEQEQYLGRKLELIKL